MREMFSSLLLFAFCRDSMSSCNKEKISIEGRIKLKKKKKNLISNGEEGEGQVPVSLCLFGLPQQELEKKKNSHFACNIKPTCTPCGV